MTIDHVISKVYRQTAEKLVEEVGPFQNRTLNDALVSQTARKLVDQAIEEILTEQIARNPLFATGSP